MSNEPTLVVLGASGDLAARLLFPALLSLEHRERLEDLRIIGYARQEWTTEQFHENLRGRDRHATVDDVDEKYLDRFIDRIEFHGGDISVESLRGLNDVLDGPAIFYLALPPGVFADAAETIAKAGPGRRDQRLAPARHREAVRHRSRVRARAQRAAAPVLARRPDLPHRPLPRQGDGAEHARVPVREPVHRAGAASRAHVDEIQITVAETLGVEGRSRYYDGIGALRDMIQNHLMQMMTFATMEPPALWDAEMLRDHKVEVLKAVRAVDPESRRGARPVHRRAGRREAVVGYQAEPGVDPTSRTDTFAALRLHLDTWRWEGVPVLLRSGKRLAAKAHEVAYRFREPPTRLFRHTPLEHAEPELARVPHEPVRVHRARRAHEAARASISKRASRCCAPSTPNDDDNEASAYEQLLLDVLEGDHTPFLRFDEVEWSWRIVDPVLEGVGDGRARGLCRRQRRPRGPASLPRPRPLLAAAGSPRLRSAYAARRG